MRIDFYFVSGQMFELFKIDYSSLDPHDRIYLLWKADAAATKARRTQIVFIMTWMFFDSRNTE